MSRLLIWCRTLLVVTTFSYAVPLESQPSIQASDSVPTTGTPKNEGFDVQCKCIPDTVWNDVMFIIERSNMTGSNGLSEVYDTVLTTLTFMNVQTNETNDSLHLRVGVIFYASEAVLAAPLGSSLEFLFDLNTDDFYQKNDSGNNLLLGLNLATAQLDMSNPCRRRNSRKVAVIMATTYNPAGFYAPQTAAAQFRDDNGVIMTYDYIEKGGLPATLLEHLATPGYGFNSIQHSIEDLMQAQCSANCFCPDNMAVFKIDDRNAPSGGCYKAVTTAASQLLAERNCRTRHKGVLAKIETAEKNEFVGGIDPLSDTLIGLKWNTTASQWLWSDDSEITFYSNFAVSNAHTEGLDCVFMDNTQQSWKTVDCRLGFKYVCEIKPCDSTNYCDEEE